MKAKQILLPVGLLTISISITYSLLASKTSTPISPQKVSEMKVDEIKAAEVKATEAKVDQVKVDEMKVGEMPVDQISLLFNKIETTYAKDAKQMWNHEFDTSIMIIDTESKKFIANKQDANGSLKQVQVVFIGQLSEEALLSNSVISYEGKDWATAQYSKNTDDHSTLVLWLHEMFHNNQSALGLLAESESSYDNSHMDERDARVYLKLEWEALHKALMSKGKEKEIAIRDALVFRNARRDQYNSSQDENRFEIHEGLAEYTGNVLVYQDKKELMRILDKDWKMFLDKNAFPTYVRTFAYHSGVLYGVLLDEVSKDWRKSLTPESDLGELLKQAYEIDLTNILIDEIKDNYSYKAIKTYEDERQAQREQIISNYRTLFTNEVITLPCIKLNISFNPNMIWSLEELGQVYESVIVSDAWGQLNATSSPTLIRPSWNELLLSSKDIKINGNKVEGNGWVLSLNEGYRLEKLDSGNYTIVSAN